MTKPKKKSSRTSIAVPEKCGNVKPIKQHVFIVGAPRSGTTVCQVCMDTHPDISITNEQSYLHILWKVKNLIKVRQCAEAWSLRPEDIDMVMPIAEKHWCNSFEEIHSVRNPKATVIGDKLPMMSFYMNTLREWFPNCKFVWCWRNPNDTVKSMMKLYTSHKKDIKDAVNMFKAYQSIFLDNKNREDVFVLDLDFVKASKENRKKKYRQLAEFIGVEDKFDLTPMNFGQFGEDEDVTMDVDNVDLSELA